MLTVYDIVIAPFCILVIWLCFSSRLKKYDPATRRLFVKAFRFKIFCVVAFATVSAFYYKGGDSEMFFFAIKDMQNALSVNDLSLWELFRTNGMKEYTPLSFHFQQDNLKYPVYGFMRSPSNFLVPKLALIPSYIFFNSYLSICLVFASFALWGAIRLYKMFLYYFPAMRQEVALAALFLPSVTYWSAGYMKDPICFGAIGFLLYGLFNVFIKRQKIASSLFWIALGTYFLYTIKVYILLALIPGIGFWLFGHLGTGVRSIPLKRALTVLSLVVAGVAGFIFVNYLTSDTALAKFQLDNILETSSSQRDIYERSGAKLEGAYFDLSTTNVVSLGLNGLIATFFRPFPWEISSAIVLFSAMEALMFLLLIAWLFFKSGIFAVFKQIFDKPILILCFSFAIIFAVSVGMTATNFGSLSRYKIPCLPFFLMFIMAAYRLTGLAYPGWMKRILSLIAKK